MRQCEKSSKMSIQNLLLRAAIVLGMVAAVMTILYFTPMPDQNFKSCDRPCHELDWPMICRIKLTLEMYQTMNQVCQDCPKNSTHCNNQFCASADGISRGIITANRQLPGPAIQVCQNDIMVIDVVNKIPGHGVAVHWRGQPNIEAPFMDGVPMVTQCPINSFTTFQYKFRASEPGTHFYHAHSDTARTDGLFGALIVRQPDKLEPHRKLYDVDDKDHTVLISEWSRDLSTDLDGDDDTPKALLINGKSPSELQSSSTVFHVEEGKRYRFRVAYTGGSVGCPTVFSIDNHLMKIIALDGNPTQPYEASSVIISKGERFDFILKTSQEISNYLLRVKSECNNNNLEGIAVIKYQGANKNYFRDNHKSETKTVRVFESAVCNPKLGKVCLTDVRPIKKLPKELRELQVDRKIYFHFDQTSNGTFSQDSYSSRISYMINNLSFTYPPSPLLTQPEDVPTHILCNELNIPEKCLDEKICECTHIEHIPLGASTEIILADQGGSEDEHIFHLHGNSFYVVAANTYDSALTKEEIKSLDYADKLFKRNLINPVLKDTIRIPKFGVVALRFVASNAGFWMLRDEKSKGWTRGLDVVLQVGDVSEMIAMPSNFPMCGNFIGPDFFLI